jgi:hypothetical protein
VEDGRTMTAEPIDWLRVRPTKVNSWDFRKQFG